MPALDVVMATIEDQLAQSLPDVATYVGMPNSVEPPCVVVGYPEIEYAATLGPTGADAHIYPLWCVVSNADEAAAREALSGMLSRAGPDSVYSALREAAWPDWLTVYRVRVEQPGVISIGGADHLGAQLRMEVTVRNV